MFNKKPFRVKLVMPDGPDAHYFYAGTYEEAMKMKETLFMEIPHQAGPKVYVYIDTSLGHVRIS